MAKKNKTTNSQVKKTTMPSPYLFPSSVGLLGASPVGLCGSWRLGFCLLAGGEQAWWRH
jgi:hypothetical protein